MLSLQQLVEKINSGTFNPESDITTATVFLETFKFQTLIEHLMPKILAKPALCKKTFERYSILMQLQPTLLNTHKLAMIKYQRLVCRFIIVNASLDKVAEVNDNLTAYFPEDDQSLHEILIRTSYQIIIGRMLDSIQTIMDLPRKIQAIRKMAEHRVYSTNRNNAVRVLNGFTSELSRSMTALSIASNETFTSVIGPIADQYHYYTSTTRTLQLGVYARVFPSLLLRGQAITSLPVVDKNAHIELLAFLYFEGNESLQKEIVFRIDDIINAKSEDTALNAHILKTFAPEPLGKLAYAVHANSTNILSALQPESSLKLLAASQHLLTDQRDKDDVANALQALTSTTFAPYSKDLSFHASTPASSRWLAYLLCMGDFPKVQKVNIHADNISMDDHMLLSYLMGSGKLALSSSDPTAIAVVSPFPVKCIIEGRGVTSAQQVQPKKAQTPKCTDEEICDLLNSRKIFEGSHEPLHYQLMTTNNIEIDFILTQTAVLPGIISTENELASKELLRLLLMAFPATWGNLPATSNEWTRPCAVEEHRTIDKPHCAGIKPAHTQWVLVYEMNTAINPRFLFDINIKQGSVERGFFSNQGYGSNAQLTRHFPDLAAGFFPSRGRSNSKDATSSKHRESASPSRN